MNHIRRIRRLLAAELRRLAFAIDPDVRRMTAAEAARYARDRGAL